MHNKKNVIVMFLLIMLSFAIISEVSAASDAEADGTGFIESVDMANHGIDGERFDDRDMQDHDNDYVDEKAIVDNLYQDVKILYDVVNSKFKISQDNVIIINDITYKEILNFEEVVGHLFTDNGLDKYISDLGSYFAYTNDKYYLAGNLVSYQTYYFRGDTTNIFVVDANDMEINAIIYEKWTSNNKNTLATIRVVKNNNSWLVDNISILSSE